MTFDIEKARKTMRAIYTGWHMQIPVKITAIGEEYCLVKADFVHKDTKEISVKHNELVNVPDPEEAKNFDWNKMDMPDFEKEILKDIEKIDDLHLSLKIEKKVLLLLEMLSDAHAMDDMGRDKEKLMANVICGSSIEELSHHKELPKKKKVGYVAPFDIYDSKDDKDLRGVKAVRVEYEEGE